MNRHRLRGDADIAAANASVAQQAAGDELRGVDANGETDPLRRQNRSRVHSNHSACGIDQRAAGVAGVECGIGLNDIVDQASGIRPQRTSQCADHACRHRRLKSVRIADGDDELSHAQLLRIAERGGGEAGLI